MRRREVLAGLGSLGTLGGAGAITVYGLPSGDDAGADEPRHKPIEVTTVEAPGSEPGTLRIPDTGGVTFLEFFATTCSVCKDGMPELAAAHDRVGDDVTFLSVTNESERLVDDAALREWWREHGGEWTLGRDPTSELVVYYGTSTPTAVVFDADGRVHWESTGRKTADEVVDAIERARSG